MGNAIKRGEGAAEQIGGKVKGAVGKLLNNHRMQAEGKVEELRGKARKEAAKSAERAKGKVEEVVGAVKNRVGSAIDNERMQAKGKLKELRGETRQRANR